MSSDPPRYEADMFGEPVPEPVEALLVNFEYRFRCDGRDCHGHKMISVDWEICQSYRRWR
jgi:hypothetical protein